MFDF